MPAPVQCAPCCTTPLTISVPGGQGLPGGAAINGINAFTATSASFVIPAINSTVTINVLNSQWMAIGELLFISDGIKQGTFQVTAIPTTSSVTIKFLGFPGDSTPGSTIGSPAVVTPTGQKFTPPSPQNVYGSGAVYELTATPAQLAMGANPPTMAFAGSGTFLVWAWANIKFLSATWAANHTMDLHVRRTNNTPTDLAPAVTATTPIITTATQNFGSLWQLPPLIYVATIGDVLELWGSLSAQLDNYSAGVHAVQVTQTALIFQQLF